MRVRIREALSQGKRQIARLISGPSCRSRRLPQVEVLEDRQLLTATLQPITSFTVPAQQGFTQPLLAATGTTDNQTFTVTSSNPDIAVSIAQGPFFTVGVSYTDPTNSANDFTGDLSFDLFNGLTNTAVSQIEQYVSDGYYVNTGKYFPRIVTGFGGTPFTVVQGGANSLTGVGSSGQPGTPFANESFQQLPLSGVDQLALANAGASPPSNDTQFFINTGSLNAQLGYGFTVFGQMVTGQATLGKMAVIPTMPTNTGTGEANTEPKYPLTITSATISQTDPNGVLIVDTTQAKAGETATIVVTAHDGTSTTSQSFTVTVGAYGGPADPTINFRPFANATTASVSNTVPQQIQLNGASGYPDASTPGTLTYSLLSQPAHGTVSDFNPSTGTLTYTADPGYTGPDNFYYQVTAVGPSAAPTPTTISNPGPVNINVGVGAFDTGAVQLIGTAPNQVLVITPVPRTDHGTNKIEVAQIPDASATDGAVLQVEVNGQLDTTMPALGDIDRIIVFGGRQANNDIVVDPSVQVATTIDGGHGLVNYLTGGGGPTREHGWFGTTTLIGGEGVNQLIGLAGHVRFKPSKATNIIFAGKPARRSAQLNPREPSGTFFKFVDGRLIPVAKVGPDPSSPTTSVAKISEHHSSAKVNPGGPMKSSVNQPLKPAG
jgi:cyclophilin family peptidyl-prolyl cis-trans isomerase